MKKLLALVLALCMVFALCACGAGNDNKEDEKNNNTVNNEVNNNDADDESKDESDEDEGVQNQAGFQVKIVDEGGNPIKGVMVQICKDSCVPAMSDDNGIASFNVQIEDGHKLSIMSKPDGYEYDGEAEVYLEAGATEYTLTLRATK